MKLLNRLSLTTKTRLPVVMVLIIMSSVVAVAYTSFTEQQRVNRTVVEQILPVQNSLEDAYRDFYQVIAAGQGLIVGGLTTENVAHQKAEFLDNGNKARDRLSQVQTLIDAGLLGKQYQSNLDLMLAEFDRWLAHYQAVFADPHESSQLLTNHFQASQQQFTSIRQQLNLLKDAIELSQQALRQEVQASSQHAQQVLSMGTLSAILLALTLTWSVTRLTLRPLNQMQRALEDIAQGEGDLTRRLTITSHDEIGALGSAFNRFIDQVHKIVSDVSQTACTVQSASRQLHSLMEQMLTNAEEQQRQSDQIAAAVEEQSATSTLMVEHASQTEHASTKAAGQVHSATADLMNTVAAMEALARDIHSSEQGIQRLEQDVGHISSVLDVIRGIAEQTNLLALNAAIEAARAGEQGRGFAVVADEVRTLASKTQHSTGEIQQMIERLQQGSQLAVQKMEASSHSGTQAVAQAHQTRESLSQMTQAITIINEMNGQIRDAAHEQSGVSTEINHNLSVVACNGRAMLENLEIIRQTCGQLGAQSQQLATTVQQFKL
ncbi:methyl-accepting chemotaxis protein [Aeromonas bestiarum]|jgi:methyl-accepting chemotaxis protein|uniref:methyl-accepting chemotaxis protein n=1 Tax=Aeromonas bestiarum TaxID=105751 RepID=UPI002378B294|nr:methyl-accepting chemotaxis protein [Aeromonas bestiarum]WDL82692.1 methyl-accepting chemotaxis protein [Aeromonas bestiarum]